MKFRKIAAFFAAAVSAAVLAVSPVLAEDTEKKEVKMVTSYLTGEQVKETIGRRRPVALMLNNIQDAIPQCGIENASVVYEAEVEGLITRLMGIFEDYKDVPRIGSIRSSRPYYVYFAREFNALYGHYGQAIYAVPLLNLGSTDNISGISEGWFDPAGEAAYYRSDDRPSPHNVFTDRERLISAIKELGYTRKYADGYKGHYQFAADGETVNLENGQIARVVLPGYNYNHARFDYNEEDGLYYRSQYGAPQVDGNTGSQIAYKNIIIQSCESTPFDDNGYLWTNPVSGGNGWYITNGRAEKITWKKENWSEDDQVVTTLDSAYVSVPVRECDFNVTRYYDESGNEIRLNQGKTWVCIVRNDHADHVIISDDPSVDSSVIDF